MRDLALLALPSYAGADAGEGNGDKGGSKQRNSK
jgi:hypothetical protein